jgi:hypothetical protein
MATWKLNVTQKDGQVTNMDWLVRCFEPKHALNQRESLLICNGHESHITAEFIARMLIILPNSPHLTTPEETSSINPRALCTMRISRRIRSATLSCATDNELPTGVCTGESPYGVAGGGSTTDGARAVSIPLTRSAVQLLAIWCLSGDSSHEKGESDADETHVVGGIDGRVERMFW